MTHHLYFGPNCLGRVDDVFEHQGTFFGDFTLLTDREIDGEMGRLFAFIDFCQDWYGKQASESPPDASGFGQFSELIGGQQWTILDDSNVQRLISDAPMFNGGRRGQISWVMSSI